MYDFKAFKELPRAQVRVGVLEGAQQEGKLTPFAAEIGGAYPVDRRRFGGR
jgi:hypothetical protein